MEERSKQFAIDLAKHAGEIIMASFTLGMEKEWKADDSPVTVTDKEINALVIHTIRQRFPQDSIVAEEGSHIVHDSEYTWVCDPIDGTVPFAHGMPLSTFSLALTRNGEPVIAVVYDPFMDRLFHAEKGKGAFLHEKQIHVSKTPDLSGAVVSLSGFRPEHYDLNILQSPQVTKRVHFLNIKSTVYAGMLVACGEFTTGWYSADKPWDVAAIKLIVEEAGGKATDLAGNEQRYDQKINGFISSNGAVHDFTVAQIAASKK